MKNSSVGRALNEYDIVRAQHKTLMRVLRSLMDAGLVKEGDKVHAGYFVLSDALYALEKQKIEEHGAAIQQRLFD